ncbi:MAG: hypothetical protein O3C32_02700 [Bacteroidetes bacterium]|nr:hypothetical protein [Bacteroidota bacterium]
MGKKIRNGVFALLRLCLCTFVLSTLQAQQFHSDANLRELAEADTIVRIYSRESGNFSGVFFARISDSKKWGVFNAFSDSKGNSQVISMLFDSLTLVHHPVYVYLAWQDGKMGLVENSRIQERVPVFIYQDGMYALDAQQNHYVLVKEKNRWSVLDARSQRPLSGKTWADPLRIPLPVR